MPSVPAFELSDGPEYAYSQVGAHLEARIRAGELAPGARLPNERDLASEYGVALGTVRKAVAMLREKGLAITAASKGTFILGP